LPGEMTKLKNSLPASRNLIWVKHLRVAGFDSTPLAGFEVTGDTGEQGAVNAVFFQHELQFLAQDFVNLSGGPSQQLFPRHNARLARQTTQGKARITV
jgi:hypothetical protein